jgi:hypothetical protein
MILVSGFNVYPNELEEVVAMHPGVLEVAAIGVPDEHSGEAVTAFVVKRDQGVTEEQLRSFCRESLTGYKVPRHIIFRDSLPKTNVGKVLRRELRDEKKQASAALTHCYRVARFRMAHPMDFSMTVIARSEATRQSSLYLLPRKTGLLRYARNDEMQPV